MMRSLRRIVGNEEGIANLEYALIAGLIFSLVLNAAGVLAPKLTAAFGNLGNTLLLRDKGT